MEKVKDYLKGIEGRINYGSVLKFNNLMLVHSDASKMSTEYAGLNILKEMVNSFDIDGSIIRLYGDGVLDGNPLFRSMNKLVSLDHSFYDASKRISSSSFASSNLGVDGLVNFISSISDSTKVFYISGLELLSSEDLGPVLDRLYRLTYSGDVTIIVSLPYTKEDLVLLESPYGKSKVTRRHLKYASNLTIPVSFHFTGSDYIFNN